MTAAELSRKAQVPKQSLSGWLLGRSPRDIRQLKRVADVFGVTVDHLMFGQGRTRGDVANAQIEELFGDEWISGVFEVRIRRLRKS